MTLNPQAKILYAFKEAGIIRAAQYRRALAHSKFSELAGYSDPSQYLMWLVSWNIVPEEQLKAACTRAVSRSNRNEAHPHQETLEHAVLMLDSFRESITKQSFDVLVAEELITPEERDRALYQRWYDEVPASNILASPAVAMVSMALWGKISGARLSAEAVRAANGSARQAEILSEASDSYTWIKAASSRRAAIAATSPWPHWLWIAAPALMVAFIIWRMF